MGALHQGHLSLVHASKKEADITVVSIFVNPLQFNNPDDLKKYPRTITADLALLQDAGADVVFLPQYEDLYHNKSNVSVDLGPIENVFEGSFRPGHFQGVIEVLFAFFSIVNPQKVFFGLKDLQQCLVVEKLIQQHFPSIQQYNQPTDREASGLAMSSRNKRLSREGLVAASFIYETLLQLSTQSGDIQKPIQMACDELRSRNIEPEYLELVQLPEMLVLHEIDKRKRMALVFAGYIEGVRLIDNVLIPQ